MKTDRFIQQGKPQNLDNPVSYYVMWEGTTYPMRSRNLDAVMADIADASDHEDGAHTIFARTPDGDVPVIIFRDGMGQLTQAGRFMEAEGRVRCEQEQDRPFDKLTDEDIMAGAVRWRVARAVVSSFGQKQ